MPKNEMTHHPYFNVESENLDLDRDTLSRLSPRCLKEKGIDLLVLDPGHDDSPDSLRSDAKIRGGDGSYVFLWPKVHEGRLNMITSWLLFEMMVSNPMLSPDEKNEMKTMIRLTRYPGESRFGEYDAQFGYLPSPGGRITSGVDNRRARANRMMRQHRSYDPGRIPQWSAQTKDVRSSSVLLSIHANSSEYFMEGDYIWIIPPKGIRGSHPNLDLQDSLVEGFSQNFVQFFNPNSENNSELKMIKRELQTTARVENIVDREHRLNLAMLRSGLGNSRTLKLLLEGFVMNGKAGFLAHREINQGSKKRLLRFRRNGEILEEYRVTELYQSYARAIFRSLAHYVRC